MFAMNDRGFRRAATTSIYLVSAIGLFALLVPSTGLMVALGLVGSLLATATLPGSAIVRRLFSKPGALHYAVMGTILGLGLLAMGGMLSHITGTFGIRWLPSIVAVASWLIPLRAGGSEVTEKRDFPMFGVLGSFVAFFALLPSLWTAIKSQPTAWDRWHHFYSDLPFQIALSSEVSSRVPDAFPWVGEPLSYTWLFHSAMGTWASVTGAPAADVVLQAWPVLYVGLIPAVISISAWHLTKRKEVAFGAPIMFALVHGLIISAGQFEDVELFQVSPLFQISPTRDFAHLFVLLAVVSLKKTLDTSPLQPVNWWWVVSLCISSFVASGAKGASFPILLGGLLCATCVIVLSRRFRGVDFAAATAFIVSAALGLLLVLPERGPNDAIIIGPMTFLHPDTPNRLITSIAVVGIMLLAILATWFIIGRGNKDAWVAASLIAGVCLAGLLGVSLFAHPGLSQRYFWQGAQPLLAIALVWAGATLYRNLGRKVLLAIVAVFFLGQVLWAMSQKPWLVGGAILLASVIVAVILHSKDATQQGKPRSRMLAILTVAASAAFLSQAPQLVQVPSGTTGGVASGPPDPGAIHSSQLAAFEYIRENSSPLDRVMSNKHCLSGSSETDNCDGRWFALSAFSERRVLIEGWAYTQKGSSSAWVRDEIGRNDRFITMPTLAEKRALLDDGVTHVYVDKREPYNPSLSKLALLVYESEWANVYSLEG